MSGLALSSVIPGQLVEARYEVLIPLGENTAHLWRQVVSNTFSSVIMEPRNLDSVSNSVIERRNSIATSKLVTGERQGRREVYRQYRLPQGIAQGAINFDPAQQGKAGGTNVKNAIGKGVSYVIYWKCSEDFGQELFKVSVTIYQKDILQVCRLEVANIKYEKNKYLQVGGVSYMLWMLDCFHSLDKMVNLLKSHQEVIKFLRLILTMNIEPKTLPLQGQSFVSNQEQHCKAKHNERRKSC